MIPNVKMCEYYVHSSANIPMVIFVFDHLPDDKLNLVEKISTIRSNSK